MRQLKKWSGLDLPPLPFESMESAVLRFAWSNGLSERELKAHIGAPGGRFRPDCQRLEEQTGWLLQMRTESVGDLGTLRGRTVDPWRAKLFRYCPICAEAMFHSFLFQYVDVFSCPLHDVSLRDRCMWCDHPTPAVRELYRTPMRCAHCSQYLSGAEPNVTEFLALRDDKNFLEQRLKTIHRWTVLGQTRQSDASFVMATSSRAMQKQLTKRSEEISREMARSLRATETPSGLNSLCEEDRLTGYLCVRWNYRVNGEPPLYGLQLGMPLSTIESVYRCTIREVERWISRAVWEEVAAGTGSMCLDPDALKSHWNSAALAYRLFRSHLETGFHRPPAAPVAPYREASLLRIPALPVTPSPDRQPRLGWRAAFLACYSYWYYFVQAPVNAWPLSYAAPDRGLLLLASTCEFDDHATSSDRSRGGGRPGLSVRYVGSAWFRQIPGWRYPTANARRRAM